VIPAPVIYRVEVVHGRTERVRHSFRYRHAMWFVDADALPALPRGLRWLASFRSADHLGDPHASVRQNVEGFLARHRVELDGGRIDLLTNARSLGYVFNPLSVFWCHGPDGEVRAVIAEVHNTHGERHCYLLRPDADGRADVAKDFYVSPFFAVDGTYEMSCPEPTGRVDVRIALRRDERPVFAARVSGTRDDSSRSLLAQAVRRPLASRRVMALIRLEGLRLWLRRVPITTRPRHVAQEGVQ
jgi:DUF1365 family protein